MRVASPTSHPPKSKPTNKVESCRGEPWLALNPRHLTIPSKFLGATHQLARRHHHHQPPQAHPSPRQKSPNPRHHQKQRNRLGRLCASPTEIEIDNKVEHCRGEPWLALNPATPQYHRNSVGDDPSARPPPPPSSTTAGTPLASPKIPQPATSSKTTKPVGATLCVARRNRNRQ